jgi:hypothetical protein
MGRREEKRREEVRISIAWIAHMTNIPEIY